MHVTVKLLYLFRLNNDFVAEVVIFGRDWDFDFEWQLALANGKVESRFLWKNSASHAETECECWPKLFYYRNCIMIAVAPGFLYVGRFRNILIWKMLKKKQNIVFLDFRYTFLYFLLVHKSLGNDFLCAGWWYKKQQNGWETLECDWEIPSFLNIYFT